MNYRETKSIQVIVRREHVSEEIIGKVYGVDVVKVHVLLINDKGSCERIVTRFIVRIIMGIDNESADVNVLAS